MQTGPEGQEMLAYWKLLSQAQRLGSDAVVGTLFRGDAVPN